MSASPRTVPVERPVAAAPVSSPEPLQTPQASRWRAFTAHASGHVRRFLKRPDAPRRLALALLVLAAIFAPGKLAFLAILAVLMAGVGYVSLGPDRVHELIADWHDRLAQRDPQRAEAIRLRAARVSRAAMALADRLPERWTSGLYLPDFEPAAEMPEKMKHDPFDRLAAELRAGEGGAQG
ncbi:hypothetical protein [Sinisalibacter aestuarii]|uniref:Uncharacterized protein n=1 Tax=Sinisalibacter aestuarii TaxID=2949426 RepID=A0ABQ5LTE5_9RHOB|nr:hypothetical protein [Sinisalibacter aestuarii]GKY87536.1 hypothetical protein STA1M1_14050 [Sinisalibacter aestuarii]